MMKNDEFVKYLKELSEASKSDTVMTLQEKKEWLSKAIRIPLGEVTAASEFCTEHTNGEHGEKIKKVDPLRSMDILNKLDGDYAPEKHDVQVNDLRSIIAKARARSTT